MITVFFLIVSALVFPVTWRMAFIRLVNPYDTSDRLDALLIAGSIALGVALFWPIALFALPVYFWVARPTASEKRVALEEREQELRKRAAQLGLPYDV